MAAYAQPKMDELRQQYIENIRNEVQRSTIEKVQQQIDTEVAGLIYYLHKFIHFFYYFIEKAARRATPIKSEGNANEEAEPSNREDMQTTTDPNDVEQTEKVPTPDEEEQQQTQRSSPPPASPPPPPTEVPQEDLRGVGPEDEQTQVESIGPVTADHPEVKKSC